MSLLEEFGCEERQEERCERRLRCSGGVDRRVLFLGVRHGSHLDVREGRRRAGVRPSAYPYVALLQNAEGASGPELVMACEGAIDPVGLLEVMTTAIAEQGDVVEAARARRTEARFVSFRFVFHPSLGFVSTSDRVIVWSLPFN